jgi:hypothetical protein
VNKWLTGVLIAIAVGITWLVGNLSGGIPDSLLSTPCSSSVIVFEQKKRCGFLDLGQQVTAVGTVKSTRTHTDGDQSLNIRLDPGYEQLLFYQGRKTRNYLHVEFMPCERGYKDVNVVLEAVKQRFEAGEKIRVSITGRWAYDGVDHRGKWRDQLGRCLGGRKADPELGWTEIHPAYHIEILAGEDANGVE